LPFVFVSIAGVLLATLAGIEPAQGVSVAARMMRAIVTLGLGAMIYFAVSLWPRNPEDLRSSLRWLYLGFALALLWGTLQVVYVLWYSDEYFNLISELQRYISIRRLFPTRISGLTYEPNWFAEQIALLLLPFLLGAVSRGYSVYRWRWRWLTIEWFFLGWALMVLIFTFSRTGLAIALLLLFLSVILYLPKKSSKEESVQGLVRRSMLLRIGIAGLLVLILSTVIFFAGTRSNYFSRIWRYWTEDTKTSSYLEYIAFSQRFIYWQAAYNMYESHPILGVGLGNYAFFFEDNLPDRPYNTVPEILKVVTQSQRTGRLITSKNLFARLVAETGLAGIATFMAFLLAVIGCALYLWLSDRMNEKFWGAAGLLGLTAFFVTALSTDSFAIPNMWVVFGFATAAAQIFSHSDRGDEQKEYLIGG
jgi:O-antigen ligase